ncbi:uncharacterized protein BX663DRAFT_293039 [Cokeromyces recurvatus]|uniref:uncharacterized protein n=1 Tax=Cokeromyces recurvatus TaxID=90255 RepID=UPI00221FA7CB|nr:uncharacterized protein BX663DRAFT_293039 [Cokeromyces recurvatus]KAI7905763.1 hypothetical protein BX663DRAFT_293039 [Cokeromyces recurvatus]
MPSDEDACYICEGDRSTSKNPIIFCDGKGCNMPVHKRCYNVEEIPDDDWFCDRCDNKRKKKATNIICCPMQTGAVKKTDVAGEFMHVVCAMWNKLIDEGKLPYSVPRSLLNIHECKYCHQNKGLCIQCEEPGCQIYFHATCAINNSLITPAAFVPPHFSPRCGQHQAQNKSIGMKKGRRLRPSRDLSDDESENSEEEIKKKQIMMPRKKQKLSLPSLLSSPIKKENSNRNLFFEKEEEEEEKVDGSSSSSSSNSNNGSGNSSSSSDDDMGTSSSSKSKSSNMSKVNSLAILNNRTEDTSHRESSGKQKLPNNNGIIRTNNNNPTMMTSPIKKYKGPSIIKDIEIQNSQQRWNSSHQQPMTPYGNNASFFDNYELMKSQRNSSKSVDNNSEELLKLREEVKRLNGFKKSVSDIFQGLNVPLQGSNVPSPINDIENYVSYLQLVLKRVGPIREQDRIQIQEYVKKL